MRDRARDWSERGRRPRARLCFSLAPVSHILWTRKERDCVQSMQNTASELLCTLWLALHKIVKSTIFLPVMTIKFAFGFIGFILNGFNMQP